MEGESVELQRTDSICPSPDMQLLEYVRANHVPKIRSLVEENPEILKVIIAHPYNKPILHIACYELAERTNPQTVKALVELGADLYFSDEVQNHREALHFAALGQNPAVLRTIIDNVRPEAISTLCDGNNTALNLLIKEGDGQNPNFVECVRILVQSGVDVNKSDIKNLTPIFWAAKKGYSEVGRIILYESGVDVDIDTHKLRGKSARDYMAENKLSEAYTTPNNNQVSPGNGDELFGHLKARDERAFVSCSSLTDYIDLEDGIHTLLQLAAKKGLEQAVRHLLANNADPNKITLKTTLMPIEIAAIEGYHAIVALLLEHDAIVVPPGILLELLKYIDNEVVTEEINHNLCYTLLMKNKGKLLNVNATDQAGNTPLHFAVKYGGAEKTLQLLRAGASMACKNEYGALPVEEIDANTLETHLNECLEANVDTNIDRENFTATYNYRTLMPPSYQVKNEDLTKNVYDAEAAKKLIANEIEQLTTETQVIRYMSKSPELKHLLKHPVITSFLYMKWHRIRWFFYVNLAFYLTFCFSLILYILLIYGNQTDDQNKGAAYALSVLLFITFVILAARELFQLTVAPRTYFCNFENWLELVLLALTAVILFQRSPYPEIRKQVAAITILLAAFEMVLLIGQHPKMSTNIVMLRTVSVNFFKFLLWYSILIVAFSLSFYTLFKDQAGDGKGETGGNEEETDFFVDPGMSLFKTIVMLTGEFEAASIAFHMFPITSHIIFMLFVFMIAIILFNLLNGLAVSDTQLIKSNAELVGHIARIEHIAYIESMLLGHILPKTILQFLQKYCCCLPLNITNRFIVPGILVKRVCLFPYFLRDYRMTVFPNQHARVALADADGPAIEKNGCFAQCTNIYLDKQTGKRTKRLIKNKKDALELERSEYSVFDKQEQVIAQQQKYINELKKEQQIILNKLDYIITNMSVKA